MTNETQWGAEEMKRVVSDLMRPLRPEEIEDLLNRLEAAQARIDTLTAALEAAKAGQGEAWEAVPDDTYHTDGPELIRINAARLTIVGESYVDLQQGYALCRRVAPAAGDGAGKSVSDDN